MKTLKIVLSTAFIASIALAATAQAEVLWDDALYHMVYSDSSELSNVSSYRDSVQTGIISYGDDFNKDSVWSAEYEQYVNPADFKRAEIADAGDVNQYMGSHPAAAGSNRHSVFIYNETAGEYHLQ